MSPQNQNECLKGIWPSQVGFWRVLGRTKFFRRLHEADTPDSMNQHRLFGALRKEPLLFLLLFAPFTCLALKPNVNCTKNRVSKAWEPSPLTAKLLADLEFKAFVEDAFTPKEKFLTDSIVIIKDGKLVFEKYRAPYTRDHLHRLWSMTKSFLNGLVGITVKKGLLKLEDPVHKFIPEMAEGAKKQVLIEHLLMMAPGLSWNESYTHFFASDVLPMLYGKSGSMAERVARNAMSEEAGAKYVYSSGTSNLLGAVVKAAVGAQEWGVYWDRELFRPLGIERYTFENDGSETEVASSYLYLTPLDIARFGWLYACDGFWNGSEVLPRGWVAMSSQFSPGFSRLAPKDRMDRTPHAWHWWTNQASPEHQIPTKWPDAPADTIAALGHAGQHLFVIPSEGIVAVRMGRDREERVFERNRFLKTLLGALRTRK